MQPIQSQALKNTETIILGGGCFWCVDAVYRRIPGVLSSECGYAGGDLENPRYEAVCQGDWRGFWISSGRPMIPPP